MPERLTPRGIALGHLIDLYTNPTLLDLPDRQRLALVLIEQVSLHPAKSAIEPGLADLRAAIAPLPACLWEEFQLKLIGLTEPDDLWDLMETLSALLQPPPPLIEPHEIEGEFTIDRSSLLGLYVRRIHLAFRETTFEELCTLVTHFGQWVTAANAPEASEEPAVDDAVAAAAPPPWQYLLPASQLEQHVHQLVRLVEEGLSELPAGSLPLKRQVQQLLLLAPNVPQVHYLDLLCHLQDKAYEDALGAFHRYFDKVRAASSGAVAGGGAAAGAPAPSRDSTRAPIQWASLNLARLQLVFAHKEHALAAIQEAVRSAQQHEDNVCLAYALLWMYEAHASPGPGPPRTLFEEYAAAEAAAEAARAKQQQPAGAAGAAGTAGAAGAAGGAAGAGAHQLWSTATPLSSAASASKQRALLERCLARAHELGLPELVALASQSLALRDIDAVAQARFGAPLEPVTPTSAAPEPVVNFGRVPCLPPVPLALPGALIAIDCL